MKAHLSFDSLANLANFIISRASILLFISLFLFPLIIATSNYILDNYQQCNSFMPSTNHTFLHVGHVELKSNAYKYDESPALIQTQIYTLSVLGWWTCPPSLIFKEQKRRKRKGNRGLSSQFLAFFT